MMAKRENIIIYEYELISKAGALMHGELISKSP